MNPPQDHYDETYFVEHYGALIANESRYRLLADFWSYALFESSAGLGRTDEMKILDYGCGTGVVSAALKNATGFDLSPYACEFLQRKGRRVIQKQEDIPTGGFDLLLCSHSLEHYQNPLEALGRFRKYVRKDGFLMLVLPIETDCAPTIKPDNNQHLYGWTFQSIINLLIVAGWRPIQAKKIFGPFLLTSLGRFLPARTAVRLAHLLGCAKRNAPSMRVVAQIESR